MQASVVLGAATLKLKRYFPIVLGCLESQHREGPARTGSSLAELYAFKRGRGRKRRQPTGENWLDKTPAERHVAMTWMQRLKRVFNIDLNNSLIECYTSDYTKMGAHSDQALDLADDSFIAIYSCYENPGSLKTPRTLLVRSKLFEEDNFEIPMTHGRVVIFSTDANRRFSHKIVLKGGATQKQGRWLGVTFRTSKTFVNYR